MSRSTSRPGTLLAEAVRGVAPVSDALAPAIAARLDSLTKPPGSLGRLEALAARIARIQDTVKPDVTSRAVLVFAADHGVAAEGVSAYPREVTAQMVRNFVRGGAAVNVLARQVGARLTVVDVGVDHDFAPRPGLVLDKVRRGTASIARGPAMTRAQAARAVEAGIRAAETCIGDGAALLAVGDMGIGNTTPSAAITACFTGRPAAEVTGRGTGVAPEALAGKVAVVERALAVNRPDPADPLGVLAGVGGLEIGAVAGALIGAARRRVPVLVDGFITTAGALIAHGLCPPVADYLVAAHRSAEPGHAAALDHLGLEPLLALDMRLGEGSGAVLAMHVVESAVRLMNGMATFAGAGVSEGTA
jgi:nicotinate-nucleotide--dimethylbenzimidazole phosphoribosyltransferase